jgi:thiamine transport system substrate-binding protein
LPAVGLPAGFDTLIQPEKALILSSDDAAAMRSEAVDEWLNALSR